MGRSARGSGRSEEGVAFLLCLMAVALFSLLGLSMAINAGTLLRISDNYETQVRARYAALAGLSHARDALRGLRYDDLLRGPDGAYDSGDAYRLLASSYAFRNPLNWVTARWLNIADPALELAGLPDDGLLHDPRHADRGGGILIPLTGIALPGATPDATDLVFQSRYFVKATDNSGDATETAADLEDNPFSDGDGVIIVRSMGIARTIGETVGMFQRCNSISVYEARFRRRRTFDPGAALLLRASEVLPSAAAMFEGERFVIDGGPDHPGIGTIDMQPGEGVPPSESVRLALSPAQEEGVCGAGEAPSVREIAEVIRTRPDQSLLWDNRYLLRYTSRTLARYADTHVSGGAHWSPDSAPYLGYFDSMRPANAPGQDPRITLVNGDLTLSGVVSGAGLLVVTGRMSVSGGLFFQGLVLVLGDGDLALDGAGIRIAGGVLLANLADEGTGTGGSTVRLSIAGETLLLYDPDLIQMAHSLLPVLQISFREITPSIDP